jgi:hypothetical protein
MKNSILIKRQMYGRAGFTLLRLLRTINMDLKVPMSSQVRIAARTLMARSCWCLQAATRRRQVSRSAPNVRFL